MYHGLILTGLGDGALLVPGARPSPARGHPSFLVAGLESVGTLDDVFFLESFDEEETGIDGERARSLVCNLNEKSLSQSMCTRRCFSVSTIHPFSATALSGVDP